MDELLRQLENGEFRQGEYTLALANGSKMWTANGSFALRFYPKSGAEFSFWEKRKLMKAIKNGRIKQAIAPTPVKEE